MPFSDYDPQYQAWREQQMRRLDEDYRSWRQERQRRFENEFETWRQQRAPQGDLQRAPSAGTTGSVAGEGTTSAPSTHETMAAGGPALSAGSEALKK
jgi:hypothetical protein